MKTGSLTIFSMILLVLSMYFVSAQAADYCCEKTTYGAWCQNAPQEKCNDKFRMAPTSCDATSYCKEGCCYDSMEGICMENTPQKVCDDNKGNWHDNAECDIPQCQLGCCVLDTQAAFVSLTRCKKLSGFYGVDTDFRTGVASEVECIGIAQSRDMGACVYETPEYIRSCKFTTREECKKIASAGGNMTESEFYKDYLCSAEELATNCGPSPETTCIDGKEEVYFKDTCGNPANIYDASKAGENGDAEYWKKIVPKEESCGYGNSNANSKTCGNCNYFLGSLCKDAKRGSEARYGSKICSDLNCYGTSDGKDHRHGESWCSYDGNTGNGTDAVGSRHVRHICVAGEEIVEPCADYREKVCIESQTDTGDGIFTEANCIVNRWQDCVQQTEQEDCENTDRRDCYWLSASGGGGIRAEVGQTTIPGLISGNGGACLPSVPPGLKFWEEGDSQGICNIGTTQCTVYYEKGLFDSKECVDNCECLEESWASSQNNICVALGDCGGYVNWVGKYTDDGYDWKVKSTSKYLGKGIIDSLRDRAGV